MKCKSKSTYRLHHRVYTVRRTDFGALDFERVEKAHFLRYTLATIVLSFGNLTKLSNSLFGLVPENSLLDKCPYYRVPNPEEAPNVPRSLKWVVATREKIAREKVPTKRTDHLAKVHFSRKNYKRDNLTIPGMISIKNSRAMPRKNGATLSLFLQALEGSQCIVELQNDSIVKGRLESVDGGMNMIMKDVMIKDVYGRMTKSSSLHLRASAVRYVHLPPTADPVSTVKKHRKRVDVARRENYTRQQRESMRSGGRHGT